MVFTYAYCLLRTTYSHGCQPYLYVSYELPHVVKFQKLRPAGHVGYQCWSEGKTNPNGRKAR